jgi:malate synthase
VTEAGLRTNLAVAVTYTAVWLSGNGAVAINNLMEDAATAEISRSQVWQQLRNGTVLADTGEQVTPDLVQRLLAEEVAKIAAGVSDADFEQYYQPAARLISQICLDDEYVDFLTLPAYELLTDAGSRVTA